MGLYSMPSAAEAGLPFALLANALLPIVLLMGGVRWAILKVMGFDGGEYGQEETLEPRMVSSAGVGVHVTQFKYLRQKDGGVGDCSVCVSNFMYSVFSIFPFLLCFWVEQRKGWNRLSTNLFFLPFK